MFPTLTSHETVRPRRGAMALALFALCAAAVFAGGSREAPSPARGPLRVVAAEDFYGDVAAQIAGTQARITSIMSDPNIDPHEYESNIDDAKAVADAALVIESGGGYDSWMSKLLSASPNPSRIVINAYDIAPTHLPDNEHVWYNVDNMEAIGKAMRNALSELDPSHAAAFKVNFAAFSRSLAQIREKMAQIKAKYAGTPVGLTEPVFLYQALTMGLKVLTPFAFQKAIAEGNDPPVDAAVTAEHQVTERRVRALIYNAQTVDRITTKLRNEAKAEGIPVVPVTETMPPSLHYQTWMLEQLDRLERSLGG